MISGFDWLSDADKKSIFEDNCRTVFNLPAAVPVGVAHG